MEEINDNRIEVICKNCKNINYCYENDETNNNYALEMKYIDEEEIIYLCRGCVNDYDYKKVMTSIYNFQK